MLLENGKRVAVLDAETDPFEVGRVDIRPFSWGYYDGERYLEFWNIQDDDGTEIHVCTDLFLDWLDCQDSPLIIYAHNGGKFDFHFLLSKINNFTPIKIINGRITSVKLGIHEFRDSFALLPVPLGAYKKDDIDYDLMREETRFLPEVRADISSYLKGDCVYLYELVTGFIDRYGMHLTMAGAAMAQWEKISKAENPEFEAPRTNKFYYEKIGQFYYGGRVETFETGIIDGEFEYVDINSAYPFAMLNRHPVGTEYESHGGMTGRRAESFIENRMTDLDRIFFDITATARGCLPYRSAIDRGLYYPNDGRQRRYKVTGHEVLAGLETGTLKIHEIRDALVYSQSSMLDFKNYIIPFWDERREAKLTGDQRADIWTKLFMNSLYGKFGANPDNYASFMAVPAELKNALLFGPITPDEINFFEQHDLAGWKYGGDLGPYALAYRDLDDNEKRYYNVATAASITGFVRAYLFRAIHAAEGQIYCDTDSIVARKFHGITFGKELGEWGYESASPGERVPFVFGAVAGRKMYAFRDARGAWKTASKGVRLTADEIVTVARGGVVEHTALAPTFSVRKDPTINKRRVRSTGRVLLD